MGKIGKNAVTNGFRGAIGEDLVLRQLGKQTIFSRRAVVKNPKTKHQVANQNRFAEASLFAVSELTKPDASYTYEVMAKFQGLKTAQHAAISDFLTNPEIAGVNLKKYNGRAGDVMGITPKLLCKVTGIDVRVFRRDGTLVEEGQAVRDGLNWKYIATVPNPDASTSFIELLAFDRLGKKAKFTCHADQT